MSIRCWGSLIYLRRFAWCSSFSESWGGLLHLEMGLAVCGNGLLSSGKLCLDREVLIELSASNPHSCLSTCYTKYLMNTLLPAALSGVIKRKTSFIKLAEDGTFCLHWVISAWWFTSPPPCSMIIQNKSDHPDVKKPWDTKKSSFIPRSWGKKT